MGRKKSLVYGVGVNDADYVTGEKDTVTGRWWRCPFYRKWQSMLERCYSEKYQEKYPTYIGCSVCDEWLVFSVFKEWMESQDWKGKCLDKDLLDSENKEYNPNKCVFVSNALNVFTTDSGRARGEYMIGVCFHKATKRFASQCCNPITKKQEHLGLFTSELEAHLKWKARKLEIVDELMCAGYIEDIRIYNNLKDKYSQDNWTEGKVS